MLSQKRFKPQTLSRHDEVRLFRLIRLGQAAQQRLKTGGRGLSPQCRAKMRRRVRAGKDAHNTMFLKNQGLVASVVRRYTQANRSHHDDLLQEGSIGLLKAIDKFDYRKGYKFSTYAIWWIRQAVGHAVAECSLIRTPVGRHEKIRKYLSAKSSLKKNGIEATPERIAAETGFKLSLVLKLAENHRLQNLVSLDCPLGGDDRPLHEFLPSRMADPQAELLLAQRQQQLGQMLNRLPQREREVLMLRNGFGNEQPLRLQDIAGMVGVSKERVRQIEQKAISTLRSFYRQDARTAA